MYLFSRSIARACSILCVYIDIYIYIHTYEYIYIYIYICDMVTHGSFLCSNIWQLFCDLRRFTSIYVDLYANLRRFMSIYVDLCWFTSIYVQRWPRWQPKYAKTKAQIKKYPSIMLPTKVGRPPSAAGPPLWGRLPEAAASIMCFFVACLSQFRRNPKTWNTNGTQMDGTHMEHNWNANGTQNCKMERKWNAKCTIIRSYLLI